MSENYHSYTNYKDAEDFKRLDFIVNNIRNHCTPSSKILDIGCGNGNIALSIGSLGYDVLGVDVDPQSIENGKALNKFENVKFELADANEFVSKRTFDAVICSEVLEHLTKPAELVHTISQILNPGGIFIATVPNGYGPRETLITKPVQRMVKNGHSEILGKVKKSMGYGDGTLQSSNPDLTHIQFFSKRSLFEMIGKEGFSLLQFRKADSFERVFPFSFFTRRIYALQKLDCRITDVLPAFMTSGFYTAWKK